MNRKKRVLYVSPCELRRFLFFEWYVLQGKTFKNLLLIRSFLMVPLKHLIFRNELLYLYHENETSPKSQPDH